MINEESKKPHTINDNIQLMPECYGFKRTFLYE